MKTRHKPIYLSKQRGMGATIILFTIALIVLVGAALAYASRGNPRAINAQGGRVYAGVLLKQSADYRDAYSRFIFDGNAAGTMTFNTALGAATDLFNTAAQYGIYQAPPQQAVTAGSTPAWLYGATVVVTGVGTGGAESITYVPNLTPETCREINSQLYGVPAGTAIPANAAALAALGPIDATASAGGRASGCFVTSDGINVFYTTLGES